MTFARTLALIALLGGATAAAAGSGQEKPLTALHAADLWRSAQDVQRDIETLPELYEALEQAILKQVLGHGSEDTVAAAAQAYYAMAGRVMARDLRTLELLEGELVAMGFRYVPRRLWGTQDRGKIQRADARDLSAPLSQTLGRILSISRALPSDLDFEIFWKAFKEIYVPSWPMDRHWLENRLKELRLRYLGDNDCSSALSMKAIWDGDGIASPRTPPSSASN